MTLSSQVNIWLDLKKITTKGFFAGSVLVGSKVFQKKSIPKSDPGNMPNLHNFKMATPQNFNVQQTIFWFTLDPINVLPTYINMVPKCQISLFPTHYDVIVTS